MILATTWPAPAAGPLVPAPSAAPVVKANVTRVPPKALLGFPMEKAPAREKIGNAEFPSVWNQRWKEGMQLHWDGNNTAVNERNLSAGFGTGATPTTLDKEKVLRTAAFLWDQAKPPAFPEQRIDRALVAQGEPVYRAHCWSCRRSESRTPRATNAGADRSSSPRAPRMR